MIDIKRLNELHAATTQGPWSRCMANAGTCMCGLVWGSDLDSVVANCGSDPLVADEIPKITDEQMVANSEWVAASHNTWPAVAAELTRLREFARLVRSGIEIHESEIRDEWTVASVAWLDAKTKKAGE
jgi:hypothetical protein